MARFFPEGAGFDLPLIRGSWRGRLCDHIEGVFIEKRDFKASTFEKNKIKNKMKGRKLSCEPQLPSLPEGAAGPGAGGWGSEEEARRLQGGRGGGRAFPQFHWG